MLDEDAREQNRWRILVAITGTVDGQRALEQAIELAARTDAELTGLVVEGRLPAYAATVGEVDEENRRRKPSSTPSGGSRPTRRQNEASHSSSEPDRARSSALSSAKHAVTASISS